MKELITANLDIWSAAVTAKTSGAGRSSGNKGAYGINKLRELILELAVRGKLVPQDSSDEPASELLKRILAEKLKNKKEKSMLVVTDLEKPFELPDSWVWSFLPDVSEYKVGRTPSTKSSVYWTEGDGYNWVSIADLNHSGSVFETAKQVTTQAVSEVFRSQPAPAGTILMSFKLTLGKISILAIPAFHNEAIISIYPNKCILKDYLFKVLPSRALSGNSKSAIKGNTLNSESIAALLIPLPPIAEQQRIVAKVDELMALCDQLEAEQANSAEAHEKLVSILLDALTQGDNFPESWMRLQEHFDKLFITPASIDMLKQTILQLAVQGKLVFQDPNEEPASELLKKLAVEKVRLSKQSNIKNQIVFPQIKEDEKPFDIPEGWSWSTVQALSRPKEIVTYGILKPVWVDDGVPTVRISEMGKGVIEVDALRNCDPVRASKFEKTRLISGDLLITKDGTIGKTAFVPPELEGGNITQHVLRFSINDNVDRYFIRLCIDAPMSQRWMAGETKGVALKGVNVGDFRRMPLPIPPFKEQQRIVVKFDELMALCDQLKSQLVEAGEQQRKLADVMVERAVV